MESFYVRIEHMGYHNTTTIIVLFKDSNIADEWWRTISVQCTDLERISPCYYMHAHDNNAQRDDACAMKNGYINLPVEFHKYARVKWPHDSIIRGPTIGNYYSWSPPPPTIPSQDVTDHISGKTFFIRSKADPRDFWHVPRRGDFAGILLVSRTDRTRFRIIAKDAPTPLNGGPIVMIGSDAIEISEARTGRSIEVRSNRYLALGVPVSVQASEGTTEQLVVEERAEASEQLVVEERDENTADTAESTVAITPQANEQNSVLIYFKDFKTRFSVIPEDGSKFATRGLEVGDGEEWELV